MTYTVFKTLILMILLNLKSEMNGMENVANSKNSTSRGVALLFKNDLYYQVVNVYNDDNGNLLVLDLVIGEMDILLITFDSSDFFNFSYGQN